MKTLLTILLLIPTLALGQTMKLDPTLTIPVGQTGELTLAVDTDGLDITLVQAALDYDSTELEYVSTTVLLEGWWLQNEVTDPIWPPVEPGTDSKVVLQIYGGPDKSFTGSNEPVAIVRFRAVEAGTSPVAFDPACQRSYLVQRQPVVTICPADLVDALVTTTQPRPGGKNPDPNQPKTTGGEAWSALKAAWR